MDIRLPAQLEQSFLANNPSEPDRKRWTCSTCGVMEPIAITYGSKMRYVRRSCECEKLVREEKEREEQRLAWFNWQRTRTYSWLGERGSDTALLEKTFANFDASRQQRAYEMCRLFADQPSGSLVLHGTFGTGKTHLLAAVCNALLIDKRFTSVFTTSPKLFAAIQARIAAHEGYTNIIDNAIKAPLLVLDDIDKAKHTEFREEIYFEIIDERVKAGRTTAISTNRLDALAEYVGGAVCSRLKVGQIAVEMSGDDYREQL